jgi:hypothetical protein
MKKVGNGGYLYLAKEISVMPEEPVQWQCQGMVHRNGKTLVIGLTKTGKSIFGGRNGLA